MQYHNAKFMLSAAKLAQCPPDDGIEVAFAGRSNSGKSSAINAICNKKSLARTSKTPGRTQLLNFFSFDPDEQYRLVDLPGYGYAKVTEGVKRSWQKMLDDYLCKRQSLVGIVLIMDIRHPLKPFDEQMLTWAKHYQLPIHILLNKADKLGHGQRQKTLLQVKKALPDNNGLVSIQVFSALSKLGLEQACSKPNFDSVFSTVEIRFRASLRAIAGLVSAGDTRGSVKVLADYYI